MQFPSIRRFAGLVALLLAAAGFAASAGPASAGSASAGSALAGRAAKTTTFTNPIAQSSDPWIIRYRGFYYFTGTDGCDGGFLCVWKTKTLTGLGSAQKFDVFKIPACPAPNCRDDWAPEIHLVRGHFYIYYAADEGNIDHHRLFALSATTTDPTDPYAEAATGRPHGELFEPSQVFSIDPSVFTVGHKLYATWSANAKPQDGTQYIYIAPMSDPLHLSGPRVQISGPTLPWETVGLRVNEGPVGFHHGGKTFITYSASFCATSSYAVGLLTNGSGRLLDPAAWVKTGPIFKFHSGVMGPASFAPISSPDGRQDWFLVHSNTKACDPFRVIRAQRLYWDPRDGSPLLGYPVADGVPLGKPSGEPGARYTPDPYRSGWGNAFGDAAEGDNSDGRTIGSWHTAGPRGAALLSLGGTRWTQLFYAANPNFENFTVTADVARRAVGRTSANPKYGIYASYDDHKNYVAAFIDAKNHVLATYAVVQGTAQPWQNAPLPAGFDPARYHRLRVVKTGATYAFSVDGRQLQSRTFTGSAPVLLNGQPGLVTEDTRAAYRNVTVSGLD